MASSTTVTTEPEAPRPATRRHDDDAAARRRSWFALIGITALVSVPLLIALGVLHSPRWYPQLDLAQTELRVRDVGTSHTPLIGLPGRFGTFPDQGSHPGPLSFYALALFYRLYGSSAFALQAATASLHIVVVALALWVARRRGGAPMMVVVGALVAILYSSYGAEVLTEGWNPYMPVSWWFLFLLAMWSVASGDFAVLPVGVFAASFCMQTHVPYLGLAAGVLLVTVTGVAAYTYRARAGPEVRRNLWRWVLVSFALGVVLWLPPLIEEFTNDPGNLTVVSRDLRDPKDAVTGMQRGLSLLFSHLSPARLFTNSEITPERREVTGALAPGIAYSLVWLAAAVAALRARVRSLVALHAVVALAVCFAAISMVRISGIAFFYLVLWSWGITVLMGFAIVATLCMLVARRLAPEQRARWGRTGTAVVGAVLVLQTAVFAVRATDTDVPNPPVTASVGRVAGPTIAALASGDVPGGGRDGRYLVTWDDLMSLGGRGYSLFLELERNGFDVGAHRMHKVGVTEHRVRDAKDATAQVHLVSGRAIDAWARRPGQVRVAYFDPRDEAELAEFRRLQRDVGADLRRDGLDGLAEAVEHDNLAVAFVQEMPERYLARMGRLLDLGLPLAVFVGPPVA